MEEETTQEEMVDISENDLSDDDMAASLGFITTLSEQMMAPGDETDMQEDSEEDPLAEIESNTDGTPGKDKEQDDKIAKIEAMLNEMLAQENGTETEN